MNELIKQAFIGCLYAPNTMVGTGTITVNEMISRMVMLIIKKRERNSKHINIS
jgi:hypothetical protein